MVFYIVLGILVSLGLMALVWFTGDRKDDLAKWLVMVAIPVSGWAFWPFYALAAAGYFMRKRAVEQALAKEEEDKRTFLRRSHRANEVSDDEAWDEYQRRSHPDKFPAK